jgi:hypothetical protein
MMILNRKLSVDGKQEPDYHVERFGPNVYRAERNTFRLNATIAPRLCPALLAGIGGLIGFRRRRAPVAYTRRVISGTARGAV